MIKASVIIPVYNDLRIKSCLESVLKQAYPRKYYEIIVVDNNCSREIRKIIHKFPVKIVMEKKQGAYTARNKGLKIAKGEFAVFIDSDCIADKNWLKNLLKGFRNNYIGGVGGRILKTFPKNEIQEVAEDLGGQQIVPQSFPFFPYRYIVTANTAYRISLMRKIGYFDEHFQSGGDVDMAWRVQIEDCFITTVYNAIVYHSPRETIKKYFQQYFRYAYGHTLLFKKYHSLTNQKIFINIFPVKQLLLSFTAIINKLYQLKINKKDFISFYSFVIIDIALIWGNLKGSLRYRTLFL